MSEGKEGRADEGERADRYGPVLFPLLTVDESDADCNNNNDEGEAAVEMTKSQARDGEVILVNPNAFDAASQEDGGVAGSEGVGHGRKRGRGGDRQTGCGNDKMLHCTYIILSSTIVFCGNVRVVWPDNGDNNNKSTIDRNDCAKTIFGSGRIDERSNMSEGSGFHPM